MAQSRIWLYKTLLTLLQGIAMITDYFLNILRFVVAVFEGTIGNLIVGLSGVTFVIGCLLWLVDSKYGFLVKASIGPLILFSPWGLPLLVHLLIEGVRALKDKLLIALGNKLVDHYQSTQNE